MAATYTRPSRYLEEECEEVSSEEEVDDNTLTRMEELDEILHRNGCTKPQAESVTSYMRNELERRGWQLCPEGTARRMVKKRGQPYVDEEGRLMRNYLSGHGKFVIACPVELETIGMHTHYVYTKRQQMEAERGKFRLQQETERIRNRLKKQSKMEQQQQELERHMSMLFNKLRQELVTPRLAYTEVPDAPQEKFRQEVRRHKEKGKNWRDAPPSMPELIERIPVKCATFFHYRGTGGQTVDEFLTEEEGVYEITEDAIMSTLRKIQPLLPAKEIPTCVFNGKGTKGKEPIRMIDWSEFPDWVREADGYTGFDRETWDFEIAVLNLVKIFGFLPVFPLEEGSLVIPTVENVEVDEENCVVRWKWAYGWNTTIILSATHFMECLVENAHEIDEKLRPQFTKNTLNILHRIGLHDMAKFLTDTQSMRMIEEIEKENTEDVTVNTLVPVVPVVEEVGE